MIVEARIKEVSVPIDETTAKKGYQVEYKVSQTITAKERVASRWYFHSIYLDKDLAEYVKAGIEDQGIQVAYVR